MKISIIGTGRVGSTLGFAVVMKGLANELVLVNRTHAVAVGEALDLCHASTLAPDPIHVYAGNIEDTQGSDIVVLCASVPFGKQYTTRNDLAVGNTELFRQYVPQIVKHSPGTCLLIVTNPVDVMSYVAWKLSELPSDRVIGTGTLIDSMRYRSLLSEELGIHPDDIRAYILGEHGDSQFPALSLALYGGERVKESEAAQRLFEQTVRSGYDVVQRKGHTNFAIALAASLIIESIAHDSHRTMPVSTLIDGYAGVSDVYLSVPAVIGRAGIVRTLHPQLNHKEKQAFVQSADVVQDVIHTIGADLPHAGI